jgi:hypothetical protein
MLYANFNWKSLLRLGILVVKLDVSPIERDPIWREGPLDTEPVLDSSSLAPNAFFFFIMALIR